MMKSAAYITAALVLTGCGVQVLPIKGNGAKLDVHLSNDSTGTMMENWQLRKFDDETCEKEETGVLLSNKAFSKGRTSLDPVTLPTDNKVTLSFYYLDARVGANTQCGYTLTFVPAENQHYTARFAVTGNVSSCAVALSDAAGHPVKVTTPEYTCSAGVVAERVRNGGRGVKRYKGVTVY